MNNSRYKFFIMILIVTITLIGCSSTEIDPLSINSESATVTMEMLLPGNFFYKNYKILNQLSIDKVTIIVKGYRYNKENQKEEFTFPEDYELQIDLNTKIAQAIIEIPLGMGIPDKDTIGTSIYIGENIKIEIEMWEGDISIYSGSTEPFFVTPGTVTKAPSIKLKSNLKNVNGIEIGTISVISNPVFAFKDFKIIAEIDSQFSNDINSIQIYSRISLLDSMILIRDNINPFTFSSPKIFANFLGYAELKFGVNGDTFEEAQSYLYATINPEQTGVASEIKQYGNCDIAIGFYDDKHEIIWTDNQSQPMLIKRLVVAQMDSTTLWEIELQDSLSKGIRSNIIYGIKPEGMIQLIPPDSSKEEPKKFINGNQYYIRIEGERNLTPILATMEFVYNKFSLDNKYNK